MNLTFWSWLRTQQGRMIPLLAHAHHSQVVLTPILQFFYSSLVDSYCYFPQCFFPFSIHLHHLNSHSYCCSNQRIITFYFRDVEKPLNGNALTFPYQAHKTVCIWILPPSDYYRDTVSPLVFTNHSTHALDFIFLDFSGK